MYGTIPGNITAAAYFLLFQSAGILLIFLLYQKEKPLVKLLLGSVTGSLLLTWLPVLFSFLFDFTLVSHLLALAAALPIWIAAFRRRRALADGFRQLPGAIKEHKIFFIILPLLLLFWGGLLHTHTLLPNKNGGIDAGQCTYGDMNMHLGFITSIATQGSFPPDYSIMPGVRLSYPFLSDSISSSLYLFGCSLRFAYILPMLFAMGQIFCAVYLFARSLFRSRAKSLLTLLLYFLNGGFGFAYFISWARERSYTFSDIFTGFYLTPTNLVNQNIRWVNVIADMFLPQRATLFGYAVLFPTLWLLYLAAFQNRREYFPLAGFFAAALPMIHTHSFLSAGIVSAVWLLLWLLVRALPQKTRLSGQLSGGVVLAVFLAVMLLLEYLDRRGKIAPPVLMAVGLSLFIAAVIYGVCLLIRYLRRHGFRVLLCTWALYLLPVLCLALPQLLFWTFGQVAEGGFVRGHFNWGNQGDPYLWFYVKNIGAPLLLIVGGICACRRKTVRLFLPALFLWWLGELIVFTPNTYDNNKLLYAAYLFLCLGAADYGVNLYEKIKAIKGVRLFTASFLFLSAFSAVLTLGREWVSRYQLYGPAQTALAEYVLENTPPNAVFLTTTRHNNEIASLTGRNVVCGSDSFLYYHGLDTSARKEDLRLMFESPAEHQDLYEKYQVSYIVVSSYERGDYSLDEAAFRELFTPVYSEKGVTLYHTDLDFQSQ